MARSARLDDIGDHAGSAQERTGAHDLRQEQPSRQPGETPATPDEHRAARPNQPARRWQTLRAHPYVTAAVIVAVIAVALATLMWWLAARHFESTDDAFIDSRPVTVSAQVAGAITAVPVTDNELVPAGATLVEIDRRDYDAALAQARAQVDEGEAAIVNADAQADAQQARVAQAQEQVSQAQAALDFAEAESKRAEDLLKSGFGTQQQAQQTASNLRQGRATLDQNQANLVAAQKQIAVLAAQRQTAIGQRDQARAQVAQAQANLDRTRITAPVAGRAAKISAAVGATAQVGQALMIFVPQEVWVTANFKETQLADMRPGQEVTLTVDAYPGRTFAGHVDSVQPGSGAAFSLLPPENATGNYVKVVQRVPVKIVFDQRPDVYLGPGMSVVPSVKVR